MCPPPAVSANGRFYEKGSQLFIRVHNETLSLNTIEKQWAC
jgi:hypothetical protein